jgi:hypothetical protein
MTNEVVQQLIGNAFRLGGSRRMAEKYPEKVVIHDGTDYDFYGSDTAENRCLLESVGFNWVKATNKNYWDDLLIDIYKHGIYPIEVLIRKDVELYSKVFECISADDYAFRLWKSNPACPVNDMEAFRASVCEWFNYAFRRASPCTQTQF